LHGLTGHLANPLVIEEDRHTTLGHEYSNAVAKNKCFGMVDLESMPTHEFHGERLERRSPLKGTQCSVKVVDSHN